LRGSVAIKDTNDPTVPQAIAKGKSTWAANAEQTNGIATMPVRLLLFTICPTRRSRKMYVIAFPMFTWAKHPEFR
jgi:hypothetical protein